ncbi:MAG: DUF1846 domain-containing protein [Firmicutes bacterium]|nr:DUF1846 domain-containing protein [Bacillota bacterium]
MSKIGFDSEKYLAEQSRFILERVNSYNKLYLEFGGKLMNDTHAKRVLPGYDENCKLRLLQKLKDSAEIIICVYARDIERNKRRGDYGITYGDEVFRMMDILTSYGLLVSSVVVTRYEEQPAVQQFMTQLERRGIRCYAHRATPGYPTNVDLIVSENGYGANPYIETTRPIVVVTAPGPGSGKLATCLSQLYHEQVRNIKAGYSKFETFPVWNLPLNHPVNIAYEAATADLKDVNRLDSFHYDAYGTIAVNYNRDLETFPVLRRIIERITGKESFYKSPTDMGVNRIAYGIIDDDVVREASKQEVIRRYYKEACDYKRGLAEEDTVSKEKLLMDELNLTIYDRAVVRPALERQEKLVGEGYAPEYCQVVSLQLEDGRVITGRHSPQRVMSAVSACLLNALKALAGIDDSVHMLAPYVLEPMSNLKTNILHDRSGELNAEETINALCVCAANDKVAKLAIDQIGRLSGCQAHSTCMLTSSEEQLLRRMGVNVTCEPQFANKDLYE